MNVNVLLAGVLLWVASIAGSFWYGTIVGKNEEIATQARVNTAIEDTRAAANEGAANAISKIIVRNTTVQGRVETVVRENPVYRDCVHGPDQLRNINEALAGRTGSAGDRGMPGADAAD